MEQQHGDTLQRLHAEIEHLRRENKGEVTAAGRKSYCWNMYKNPIKGI